jgi:hypothetical protein
MNNNLIINLKKDIQELENNVFAILIYGSYVRGEAHQRSDIDVCIVLKSNKKEKIRNIFRKILRISAKNEKYDIRIFEQMPLFMRIGVIENGEVIYAKNLSELNEYFYFFRKLWQDQSVNWIMR